MRILVVEDERRLANVIKKGIVEEGFAVDVAYDGEEGQYLAEAEEYDLIILDIMLPKIDGLTICRELRHKNIKTPVLMFTAKGTIEEKVAGLDSGADDYLTKPFSFTPKEFSILELLLRHKDEVVSRTMIIEHVWDYNFDSLSMEKRIRNLRIIQ